MLRSTRPLLSASARGLPRSAAPIAPLGVSQTRRSASSTPWRARTPTTTPARQQLTPFFIQRASYAVKNERDVAFEKEVAKSKLESDPEHVTSESSVRQFEPPTKPASGTDSGGLKEDLVWPSCPFRRLWAGSEVVHVLTMEQSRAAFKKLSHSAPFLRYPTSWAWPVPYHTSRHLSLRATALGT